MTAPTRPPWFCDSLAGTEYTYPHTQEEAGWLVDRLASQAKYFPDWQIEVDDTRTIPVKLDVLETSTHPPLARIRASTADGAIEITATVDPSGWALAIATLNGAEVFRAYLDRPYEEYDLFPSGSTAGPKEEEPGRMGKKMAWISLQVAHWPVLAPLSSQGWFNACEAGR
jgi:hypothetical protein